MTFSNKVDRDTMYQYNGNIWQESSKIRETLAFWFVHQNEQEDSTKSKIGTKTF